MLFVPCIGHHTLDEIRLVRGDPGAGIGLLAGVLFASEKRAVPPIDFRA